VARYCSSLPARCNSCLSIATNRYAKGSSLNGTTHTQPTGLTSLTAVPVLRESVEHKRRCPPLQTAGRRKRVCADGGPRRRRPRSAPVCSGSTLRKQAETEDDDAVNWTPCQKVGLARQIYLRSSRMGRLSIMKQVFV
jgi:hypothetical protein